MPQHPNSWKIFFKERQFFTSQSLLKSESVPLCRMPGSLQDESMLFLDTGKHGKHVQAGCA